MNDQPLQSYTPDNTPNDRAFFGVTVILAIIALFAIVTTPLHDEPVTLPVSTATEAPYDAFGDLTLSARSAVVWDVAQGRALYAHNAETQLPLASIAKVMTAVVVTEALGEEEIVTLSPRAVSRSGNSGLLVGERWGVKDLVDFTVTMSSNDGAAALAEAVGRAGVATTSVDADEHDAFTIAVAKKIEEIGMDQTYFINGSGLDVSTETSGAYGSVVDVAKLFAYVMKDHSRLLEATRETAYNVVSEDGHTHLAINTNQFVDAIPGMIASKTGYTDIAGGNLAVAFEAGPMRPLVVVVLGSTREDRFTDVEQLAWASLHALQGGVYDVR